MTMPTTPRSELYQPSITQLERAAAMRRFNWLYVYTPVIIASLALVLLLGLLLWGTFSGKVLGTREFASGLADVIMILTIMPLLLLCLVPPGLAIAFVVYRNREKDSRPAHGALLRLFWRIDNLVVKVHQRTEHNLPKAARPLIEGHAWFAYLQECITQVKRIIKRK